MGVNEVKIPFGRSSTGTMISVDAVVRGLACECFCPSCDAPLVARKGEQIQHHFAHYAEPENCIDARETSLHKFAKQVICENMCGDVPRFRIPDNPNLGRYWCAEPEPWLNGIRPDVIVDDLNAADVYFDKQTAIEIRVAHAVPIEKIQKLAARRLATIEIDLSSYRNLDTPEDHWQQIILCTAHRFWLVQPAIIREEIELKAYEAAERLRAEERRLKELRDYRDFREAQDREFAELRAKEIERRERVRQEHERAEAEYAAYSARLHEQERVEREHDAQRHRRMIEGLKICADTKRHFEEWEKRKGRP